jgi:hypothetical protein
LFHGARTVMRHHSRTIHSRIEGGFHDKAIEGLKKEAAGFKVKSISFP